ncbi:MAG: tetratricopeptide repeat protein [Nitrospirota bacterium]
MLHRRVLRAGAACVMVGLLSGSAAGQSAPSAPPPSAAAPAGAVALLRDLETLKGRVLELERERLAFREEPIFANAELVIVLSQPLDHPIPAWITGLTLEMDGRALETLPVTPEQRAWLRDNGFALLAKRSVPPGRHQLRLLADGVGKKGAARRGEASVAIEKSAGGLWVALHFLDDAGPDQPLQVGVDQFGSLSPAIGKQRIMLPQWQAEMAARKQDLLQALSYYALAQQRGLPQAELTALQFRMADLYLAAGMPTHAAGLMAPYARQEGGREFLEAVFYLQKSAYRAQRYRDALNAFARITPKLRVSLYHEALYLAGNSTLQLKEFERAFTTLNQIPRYSEFYPFAQYSMGLAYLNFGDVYSAIESFRRLTSLEAEDNAALERLLDKARLTVGYEFLHQKRYADAIGQFALVRPSSPMFDQALFGIGWGYFKLEEFVKAAVVFKDLRRLFPNSPYSQEALVALGYAYSRLQAFKLSIDHFRLALDSVTTQAQSIQDQIDAVKQPAWKPPATLAAFPAISGLSSQVQLDDLLNYFQEEHQLQTALEQYQGLTRAIDLLDRGLVDLAQMAQSQSQWLSGQESKQRFTALHAGFEAAKKEAAALQAAFRAELARASSQWLQRQMIRLEETSVQASIGIARNLVLDTAGLQEGL